MINIAEKYYIKAFENFDYDMEQMVESLSYALSYDENHAPSLVLMARFQVKYLGNYSLAYHYYEKALAADLNYIHTYSYYADALISGGRHKKAMKLLEFAIGRKGIDKAEIYRLASVLHESIENFKLALKFINLAIENNFNPYLDDFYNLYKARIKQKLKNSKKRT